MFQLYDDKVAIIPFFDRDMTASGLLYIPEIAKERCDQGIVKYVGPNCKWLKPGDYVIFSGYVGAAIHDEHEGTLIIFREEFAAAVITDDKVPNTEVPGLYFRGVDGVYFPANYEQAMAFIAKAIEEAPWRASFKTIQKEEHRPKEAASHR
jgi:co-chaperonin GroES (HSP10)